MIVKFDLHSILESADVPLMGELDFSNFMGMLLDEQIIGFQTHLKLLFESLDVARNGFLRCAGKVFVINA